MEAPMPGYVMQRKCEMKEIKHVILNPQGLEVDGIMLSRQSLSGIYKEFIGDYPKFFKMDNLCKLGFLAAEFAFKNLDLKDRENTAIILFNRNGSLITDRNYQSTLKEDNYFPSPALFVYTLANIVTGEIAIRNKIYGETSFYILPAKDDQVMGKMVESVFTTSNPSFILYGWVDYENEKTYLADLKLITKS